MTRIELRKERDTALKHEYLLMHIHDHTHTVFCLERRADPDALTNIVLPSGTDASDIMYNATRRGTLEPLRQTSDSLVELAFTPALDLLVLLLICHGMQTDDQGQTYTLQRFNCYFFERTVVAAMARHASMDPWDPAVNSDDTMILSIAQTKSAAREDQRPSSRLQRLIRKHDLGSLRDALTQELWRELFQGSLQLDVRMALRQTLWRTNAQSTVENAIC